jgi:hypothetical protein
VRSNTTTIRHLIIEKESIGAKSDLTRGRTWNLLI